LGSYLVFPLLNVLFVTGVGGFFFDGGALTGVDDWEEGGLLVDEGARRVILIAVGPRFSDISFVGLCVIAKLKLSTFSFLLSHLSPLLLFFFYHFPIYFLLDAALHPSH